MHKYLFLILFMPLLSHGAPSSSEIEFKNNSIYFQAIKNSDTLKFTDDFGPRELQIKSCNKEIIEKFWNDLVKNIHSLQGPNLPEGRKPTSEVWVKYEGIQSTVLSFEPAMKAFNQVPLHSHVLFSESKRLCRKK